MVTSGIGAATFSVAQVPVDISTVVTFYYSFYEYAPMGKSARQSFEATSAILLNGGLPFPWTTTTYSFAPFTIPNPPRMGNISAVSQAFSSTLDCAVLPSGSMSILVNTRDGKDSPSVSFIFTDRGCVVDNLDINPTEDPPLWTKSWTKSNCGPESDEFRHGLIVGTWDNSSGFYLSNFTLLSCTPTIWNSTTHVTATLNGSESAQIVDSSILQSEPVDLAFFRSYLGDIPLTEIYGPNAVMAGDIMSTLVYEHAAKQHGNNSLDSENLVDSFKVVYSAAFATFVGLEGYVPLESPITLPGTLSTSQNRLFVVIQPAAVLILVVSIALISTVVISWYVRRMRRLLVQNKELILGHSLLLKDNVGLETYIKELERLASSTTSLENVDLVRCAENSESLASWECWQDIDDRGQAGRVHIKYVPPNPSDGAVTAMLHSIHISTD
jgi:hypothetical protein